MQSTSLVDTHAGNKSAGCKTCTCNIGPGSVSVACSSVIERKASLCAGQSGSDASKHCVKGKDVVFHNYSPKNLEKSIQFNLTSKGKVADDACCKRLEIAEECSTYHCKSPEEKYYFKTTWDNWWGTVYAVLCENLQPGYKKCGLGLSAGSIQKEIFDVALSKMGKNRTTTTKKCKSVIEVFIAVLIDESVEIMSELPTKMYKKWVNVIDDYWFETICRERYTSVVLKLNVATNCVVIDWKSVAEIWDFASDSWKETF